MVLVVLLQSQIFSEAALVLEEGFRFFLLLLLLLLLLLGRRWLFLDEQRNAVDVFSAQLAFQVAEVHLGS